MWFCSDGCARKSGEIKGLDRVQEYSKSLTWEGLNHLIRKDAIREGDGEAMLDYWSMDLIQFGNRNHPNYMKLAHQLLAGKSLWRFLW